MALDHNGPCLLKFKKETHLLKCFCVGYKIDHFVDIGQDLNSLNFVVFNSLSCIDDRVSYDGQLTNFLIEYVGKMAGTHQVSRQFLPRIVCVCISS